MEDRRSSPLSASSKHTICPKALCRYFRCALRVALPRRDHTSITRCNWASRQARRLELLCGACDVGVLDPRCLVREDFWVVGVD